MRRATLITGLFILAASVGGRPAAAEPVSLAKEMVYSEPNADGYVTGLLPIDPGAYTPPDDPLGGYSGSRILFVDPCWTGCTISGGFTDSRTNRFDGLSGSTTITRYPFGQESWDRLVSCVSDIYAPFGITVTDADPGSMTSHFEAIAAGYPSQMGAPDQVLGFSPGGCFGGEGAVIQNVISFSFAAHMGELYGDWPEFICEVVAQESAHGMGLPDHLLNECDPMTYLTGCEGEKSFQNADAQCGEYNPKSCACGGTRVNSFQTLLGIFGAATPTPPEVVITSPENNAQVERGFIIRTQVTDEQGVDRVDVYIDDVLRDTGTVPPYIFNAPIDLADGVHQVRVVGVDILGNSGSASIQVIVGEPCGGDDDCAEGEACVEGRCVAGPGTPGGLGEECDGAGACASGLCGELGGEQLCTETCTPEAAACPSGFDCLAAAGSDQGVCWPGTGGGDGDGVGGCCSVGGRQPAPWGALLLAVGVLLGIFRRERFRGRRSRC